MCSHDGEEIGVVYVYNVPEWQWALMRARLEAYCKEKGYAPGSYVKWKHLDDRTSRATARFMHGDTVAGRLAGVLEVEYALDEWVGYGLHRHMVEPGPELYTVANTACFNPNRGIRLPGSWLYNVFCDHPDDTDTDKPMYWGWEISGRIPQGISQINYLERSCKAIDKYKESIGWLRPRGLLTWPAAKHHEEAAAAWVPVAMFGGPYDGSKKLVDTRHEYWTDAFSAGTRGRYVWGKGLQGEKVLRWDESEEVDHE